MEKPLRLHTPIESGSVLHAMVARHVKFSGRQMLFFSNYFMINGIKMFFLFLWMLPDTCVIHLLWARRHWQTLYKETSKHTHCLSDGWTEPRHRMGQHLCHCCGNCCGETYSISFHGLLVNNVSISSEMQIACQGGGCQHNVFLHHKPEYLGCFKQANRKSGVHLMLGSYFTQSRSHTQTHPSGVFYAFIWL